MTNGPTRDKEEKRETNKQLRVTKRWRETDNWKGGKRRDTSRHPAA